MKIGLYFGTFNPIHVGHMIIANYMVEFTDLEEVWFVVTPHNPLKKKKTLLADHHRYQMVRIATDDFPKLKPSNIEFELPQPNYTINTLAHLFDKFPNHDFNLIMGEDNLHSFHKWKNYKAILKNYQIYIYPRVNKSNTETEFHHHPKINFVDAPIVEISATFIRNAIKEKKNIQPLLPLKVWNYLDEMNFYK